PPQYIHFPYTTLFRSLSSSFLNSCDPKPTAFTPAVNHCSRLCCVHVTPPVGIMDISGNRGSTAFTNEGPKIPPGNILINVKPERLAFPISDGVIHPGIQKMSCSLATVAIASSNSGLTKNSQPNAMKRAACVPLRIVPMPKLRSGRNLFLWSNNFSKLDSA